MVDCPTPEWTAGSPIRAWRRSPMPGRTRGSRLPKAMAGYREASRAVAAALFPAAPATRRSVLWAHGPDRARSAQAGKVARPASAGWTGFRHGGKVPDSGGGPSAAAEVGRHTAGAATMWQLPTVRLWRRAFRGARKGKDAMGHRLTAVTAGAFLFAAACGGGGSSSSATGATGRSGDRRNLAGRRSDHRRVQHRRFPWMAAAPLARPMRRLRQRDLRPGRQRWQLLQRRLRDTGDA